MIPPSSCLLRWIVAAALLLWLGLPGAQPVARWIAVPRVQGHLTASDIGLVINSADPYSVAVGEYYQQQRGIPALQVLRVELPVRATLTQAEFDAFASRVREAMGSRVQGLALAWTQPYAVECNSITSAMTFGFQPDLCKQTCAPSKPSPYFNNGSSRPFTELGLRPSMLLAGRDIAAGKALIDRGVASDRTLAKPGLPPAHAVFVNTSDRARNVRSVLFPPAGLSASRSVQVTVRDADSAAPLQRVFLYQTGLLRLDMIDKSQWLPGALADHLTSLGGQLLGTSQMSVLDWLASGATASYGTVSEPCNHLQKFPHPQILLLNYVQGATALEAYWRSVAWPAQGVFVGEPLAAPFAP